MDYESRKVKWYWLILFCGFCLGVVYLLLQSNPYLYSRQDLRSMLDVNEVVQRRPIPAQPAEVKPTPATFHSRYNLQRTGDDPIVITRSKNYGEYEHNKVELTGDDAFTFENVTSDAEGFYVTGKSPLAVAINPDGKVRWKFRFESVPDDRSLEPVLVDGESAYIIHPLGRIACVNKATGELRWYLDLNDEVVANPLIWHGQLLIPVKSGAGIEFTLVNRSNGQIAGDNPHFDQLKPGFELSASTNPDTLVATVENKVIAIDPEEWQVLWTQTLTDPIKGAAMIVGNQIFVATLGAKLDKLDASKKGKLDFEADTVKAPGAGPTFMPIMAKVAVMDTSGAISLIDAKSGKVNWRIQSENHTGLFDMWAARLKGQHIEEFKMDWLHKGWTLWSPCFDKHFCIYAPKYGQPIARVQLSGKPIALPQPVEHRWLFLTETAPGQYSVSQILEDAEIKHLKAEADKNAGNH